MRAGSAARSNVRRAAEESWNSAAGAAPRTRSSSACSPSSARTQTIAWPPSDGDRPRVAARIHALDARQRARGQEVAHLGPVVRRPEGEPEHHFVRRRRRASRAAPPPELARRAPVGRLERVVEAPQAAEAGGRARSRSSAGRVSSSRRFAKCSRRVWATAIGEAPTCCTNRRWRWRGPMPTRAASASTEASSSAPSWISRSARRTTAEVPSQAGVPGAASGRQRRQGRKPASAAAAAVA